MCILLVFRYIYIYIHICIRDLSKLFKWCFVLYNKIEFHQGKSNCKGILIAAWHLRQIPGAVSRGKVPIFFLLFNIFKVIKLHTLTLKKKLHSWPKKLNQFINNLFFKLIYPFLAEDNTMHRRISQPVAFAVGRLALHRDIYLCILHSHGGGSQQRMGKQVCSKLHLQA